MNDHLETLLTIVLVGVNFVSAFLALRTRNEILSVKLWMLEKFVAKEDMRGWNKRKGDHDHE